MKRNMDEGMKGQDLATRSNVLLFQGCGEHSKLCYPTGEKTMKRIWPSERLSKLLLQRVSNSC